MHVHPGHFALICRTPESKDSPAASVASSFRADNVHPLAIKRATCKSPVPCYRKPHLAVRSFAIHIPFQRLQFTVPQLHKLVSGNPWAYFLLINASSERCEELEHLTAELKNVGIVDERPLGEPYTLYAAIDWLLVPPCEPALGIGEQPRSARAFLRHSQAAHHRKRTRPACRAVPVCGQRRRVVSFLCAQSASRHDADRSPSFLFGIVDPGALSFDAASSCKHLCAGLCGSVSRYRNCPATRFCARSGAAAHHVFRTAQSRGAGRYA